MVKIANAVLLLVFILSPATVAGFSSYSNPYSSDSVIAPIKIKNKGIYNLVISIQFLNEPYEKKPYESDAYQKFINRLKIEWSGVTLLQVLKSDEQSLNDLAALKGKIELEIAKLIEKLKPKYLFHNDIEVVFSLYNFFLIKPQNK